VRGHGRGRLVCSQRFSQDLRPAGELASHDAMRRVCLAQRSAAVTLGSPEQFAGELKF
jgi:hypothetical protein